MSKDVKITFTKEDKQQISEKGIAIKDAEKQLKIFQTGFSYADITAAATTDRGILQLKEEDLKHYIRIYKNEFPQKKVLKFVPASGAATRMFKTLTAFKDSPEPADELLTKPAYKNVKDFFENIEKFAFYPKLKFLSEKNNVSIPADKKEILELLLSEKGMNYGNLPKALLLFHRYEKGNRTAAEEHFVEAANYIASSGKANLYFTVSKEHLEDFKTHVNRLKKKYAEAKNVIINTELSLQKQQTDTIAANMNNDAFRTEDGKLLFRPGGHGALIENLKDLRADIIFIKNIDNVVPDRLKSDTYTYKKALGGILIESANAVFDFLKALDKSSDPVIVNNAKKYLEERFSYKFPEEFDSYSNKRKKKFVRKILNRPVRVCGMVKNEGEPGGGPFFVRRKNGEESLQIVEMSQIDMNDPEKNRIAGTATHFNPVDLVISTKNYRGEAFDLLNFIDPDTGFISEKSRNGKSLKAMELPGLWNGAMADWNTIFAEVPVSTFNPVKTVNDLLRPQHLQ